MTAVLPPISRLSHGWQLASLSLAMLLPSLGTSIANAGLPTFAETFGATFQGVQWIVLAYLLAMTTLVVSAGRLGDLLGRRRLLLGGVLVFAVASAVGAVAGDLWLLVAARAAQGFGAAIMVALTMALVGDLVPKERMGSAMGLLGTTSAVGTALGPSLGGILIVAFGWPAIFVLLAALGAATLLTLHATLPGPNPRQKAYCERFDAIGTILLALSLGAYALSMTIGAGTFGRVNVALLLAAGAGLVLFTFTQARLTSPLIQLRWLDDARLRAALLATAIVSTIMMTTLVVGPFFLSEGLGLTPAAVGLAMSVGPAVAAIAGVPVGRLVDRVGTRRMMGIGLGGMIAGCLILALLAAAIGVAGYVAAVGATAAGYAAFQAANNTHVVRGATSDRRGVMSGLLNLARNLGLITGASVMGAIFAFGSGGGDGMNASPGTVAIGTALTFAVAAGLGVVSLILALTSGRSPSPR
jgi:MFS family permease